MRTRVQIAIVFLLLSVSVIAEDSRIKIDLPDMMKEHMLANMRDHLLALEQITRHLANKDYEQAAEIAEERLGMSSLKAHGASHLRKFMPQEMGMIGTRMHRSASRFAIASNNAELEGGLNKAFSALSDVMQQCVACHAAYRIH